MKSAKYFIWFFMFSPRLIFLVIYQRRKDCFVPILDQSIFINLPHYVVVSNKYHYFEVWIIQIIVAVDPDQFFMIIR